MADKVLVFVSYSHADEKWVLEGGDHALIPWLQTALRRDGFEFWCDTRLKYDTAEYRARLDAQIRGADVAVLLLSQDFLISEFIREFELPLIRERYEAGRLSVVAIQVGYLSWEGYPDYRWITDLQIIPGKPTPLIEHLHDAGKWEKVRIEILEVLRARFVSSGQPPLPPQSSRKDDGARQPQSRSGSERQPSPEPVEQVGDTIGKGRGRWSGRWTAGLVAALLGAACLAAWLLRSPSTEIRCDIVGPTDGQAVSRKTTVRVEGSLGEADPWIVVHPVGTDSFWVQAPPTHVGRGAWEGQVVVGSPSQGDRGKSFEIRAVARPSETLQEGQALGDWPAAEAKSRIVSVVRE